MTDVGEVRTARRTNQGEVEDCMKFKKLYNPLPTKLF